MKKRDCMKFFLKRFNVNAVIEYMDSSFYLNVTK